MARNIKAPDRESDVEKFLETLFSEPYGTVELIVPARDGFLPPDSKDGKAEILVMQFNVNSPLSEQRYDVYFDQALPIEEFKKQITFDELVELIKNIYPYM